MNNFKTEQEKFWATEFGNEYIQRNQSLQLLASNLNFFVKALNRASKLDSMIEFGANIGMNLKAIKLLFPNIDIKAIEINKTAATELTKVIGNENVFNESIFDVKIQHTFDLVLIKGVLIHIDPLMLGEVYQKLYKASNKYILIAEYYNTSPVAIDYRGHQNKLFKRDFAGEILQKFSDLKLVDYGFIYKNDPTFPQDDVTWFLIEKQNV